MVPIEVFRNYCFLENGPPPRCPPPRTLFPGNVIPSHPICITNEWPHVCGMEF